MDDADAQVVVCTGDAYRDDNRRPLPGIILTRKAGCLAGMADGTTRAPAGHVTAGTPNAKRSPTMLSRSGSRHKPELGCD